jgi:hypothetical protein
VLLDGSRVRWHTEVVMLAKKKRRGRRHMRGSVRVPGLDWCGAMPTGFVRCICGQSRARHGRIAEWWPGRWATATR